MNNRSKTITFGDKIFARVTRNGQTIYNFVSERVSNMADLIGQLRKAMKDVKGLVMIHIRNYNQGWGEERPLMLYAKRISMGELAEFNSNPSPSKRNMYFPWEVH